MGADELVGELSLQSLKRFVQDKYAIRVVRDDVLVFGDEVGDLRDGYFLGVLASGGFEYGSHAAFSRNFASYSSTSSLNDHKSDSSSSM